MNIFTLIIHQYMRGFLTAMLFFIIPPFTVGAFAAIHPSNRAVLNFTQVMFEYDEVPGADLYIVTIRSYDKIDSVIKISNKSLAFIQYSGLQFGKFYEWFYEAYKGNRQLSRSETYFFEIRFAFQTNKLWFRSAVDTSDARKYRDGIIFLDYMGLAVDRKGDPVWYMPLEQDSLENLKMRNVKMTPAGTITYLDNTDCFEKDIYGNTIWKAPNDGRISGDKQEYYHHDFFKTGEGTYITSGYRFNHEPNFYDKAVTTKVRYNTLIEYDTEGKIVWSWDEEKHVSKKSIYGDNGASALDITGTHLNGIAYYKPDNSFILSFRDNSSILKISKQTGEILYNFGDSLRKYNPAEIPFSGQHGPSVMKNGDVVVYNNNLERSGDKQGPAYPVVRIFSQPGRKKQSKKVWEYECVSEKYPDGIRGKEGYAAQLPYNNNLLVCMGGANYVFEVTPEKKIAWQCSFEQYDEKNAQWVDVRNYRCNYASSLYPCYFTLQDGRFQNTNNKPVIQFRMNNEGTEDIVYETELREFNGKLIKKFSPASVLAGKQQDISLPVSREIAGMSNVVLNIFVSRDPKVARELLISIQ